MPLRRIALTASMLALLVVAAAPVDAAPNLKTGTHSSYVLSATISFLQTCVPSSSSSFVCPMIAVCNSMIETCPMTTNINGTIGWTVTDLTSETASLNVTRNLTISSSDSTRPMIRVASSFNESIDLATRLVALLPSVVAEMDQILQMAQSSASNSLPGLNLPTSMPTLDGMIPQRPLYTMWWVNGPLKINDTVPVLLLPTNVTRSSTVDLGGSIGSRDAWTLDFNFSRPVIVPDPSATLGSFPGGSIEAGFAFNYDKTSDMLLSANAELHSGFEGVIPISPSTCVPSASMACPATSSPTMILGNFGIDIEASLKLTSTNLDLSERMSQTIPPQSNSGSDNGNGPGTSGGTGSDNGRNGSTGRPSSAANQPAPGGKALSWSLWIMGLLGALAAVIIASTVWISRRRRRSGPQPDSKSGQEAS